MYQPPVLFTEKPDIGQLIAYGAHAYSVNYQAVAESESSDLP